MPVLFGSYIRSAKRFARRLSASPGLRLPLKIAGCFLAGFCLSAASLRGQPQPLVLGALCAGIGGWLPIPFAFGAAVGYWHFWANAGLQGVIWTAAGLPVCALLGQRAIGHRMKLLQPALAALSVAVSGVLFQLWQGDNTSVAMYLLRIGIAFGSAMLFSVVLQRRDAVADWAAMAVAVLALAQIAPMPSLNLGIATATAMALMLPFPAVAMAGMALDLAGVTPVPMTAVLCLIFVLRLLPKLPGWSVCVLPAGVYMTVMLLCKQWDLVPMPALLTGTVAGLLLPRRPMVFHRRGATAAAQVRLELTAGVLAQMEQLLREVPQSPIDEETLIRKAAERACGACPCRKNCRQSEFLQELPIQLLHRPLVNTEELPPECRKRGRLLLELRRSQEQYRVMKADRDRHREYRSAVMQQYHFLTEFLRDVADTLPEQAEKQSARFQPKIAVRTAGKEPANGDQCVWFNGTGRKYYLLLCDGMGTGADAAEDAKGACQLLRRLLTAGFPAQYALRSLNSLCTLRGDTGAVGIDLAEISLDSGKAILYKWGAAPSWLLTELGAEKIGVAGTPPGLSVTDDRETAERVSLRRGETLILLSDGIAAQKAIPCVTNMHEAEPEALATAILQSGRGDGGDDATAAVVRLEPLYTAKE